ncbi:XdhC family protein [Picrophilus oshimae]|uniref:Xanthine dehydrogenase accessory factor n=1 Tax=Picrophilus torridus (strain ATCC 700027 / DSM 9790 / JCM 10055 / NBRC 100828 / KAW 2/3) TaxID=1122961 RepID=Q6KYV9_PICTO|nr:XdhC family protein [Picrophilus oshimae]AAT44093.1 hypothetical protein PTO1508 [Picrophilus oshimae DSM 9789]
MYEDYLEVFNKLVSENEDFILCTVISTTGNSIAKPGFKMIIHNNMIVYGTLGSAAIDNAVLNRSININEPDIINIDLGTGIDDYIKMDTTCGGTLSVYIEPYHGRKRIIIIKDPGRDIIAEAVENLSRLLGFKILIFSDDSEPDSGHYKIDDIEGTEIGRNDYVIILTRGKNDVRVINKLAGKRPDYIGLMASLNRYKSDMAMINCDIDIECPAGIEINAVSPYEIAVSILSRIISIKNKNMVKKQYIIKND